MRYLSVFLGLLFLALPVYASAAALVNINTALVQELDGLPYITPDTAQAIVDYRVAHGPFAKIDDIMNVIGIKSGIFSHIQSLITVGDTSPIIPDVASSTPSTSTAGSAPTYVPPPSAISIELSGSSSAILEVPLRLTARVTTKNGVVDSLAHVSWSFGDVSSGEGTVVNKTYHHTGTYVVRATATDGDANEYAEIDVTVKSAIVHIASVSGEGITLANDSSDRLNLSGWRILAGGGAFRIPEGMIILPRASVLLPTDITNLPIAFDATLLFPDGVVASRYTPAVAAATVSETPAPETQPAGIDESSKQIGEVVTQLEAASPIISTQANATHAEAVIAPAEAVKTDSAGAPSPTDVPAQTAAVANAPASGIFHSPWTLGFLGVMVLAGAAFILL